MFPASLTVPFWANTSVFHLYQNNRTPAKHASKSVQPQLSASFICSHARSATAQPLLLLPAGKTAVLPLLARQS